MTTLNAALLNGGVTGEMISQSPLKQDVMRRVWHYAALAALFLGLAVWAYWRGSAYSNVGQELYVWMHGSLAMVSSVAFVATLYYVVIFTVKKCRARLRVIKRSREFNALTRRYCGADPRITQGFNTGLHGEWAEKLLKKLAWLINDLERRDIGEKDERHIALTHDFLEAHRILGEFGLVKDSDHYFAQDGVSIGK
jgi:hypothetical protein